MRSLTHRHNQRVEVIIQNLTHYNTISLTLLQLYFPVANLEMWKGKSHFKSTWCGKKVLPCHILQIHKQMLRIFKMKLCSYILCSYRHTGWAKKVSLRSLHQILADFQNSFTVTFSRKFAIKRSLNIPPHLKRVATLPCEIFMSEN